MKSLFSSFEVSIKYSNEIFDEFKTQIDEFKTQLDDLATLVSRVTELEATNHQLKGSISALSDTVNRLEQTGNNQFLFLCGIPELEDDELSTVDLTVNFLNKVEGLYMSQRDIKSAIRMTPRNLQLSFSEQTKPRKILVKFYSVVERDSVKIAVRALKRKFRTVQFCDQAVNFYAADYLTPFFNQLLYSARDFVKTNKYHSVWVDNRSHILLKKTSDSSPIVIRNLFDLQKIVSPT